MPQNPRTSKSQRFCPSCKQIIPQGRGGSNHATQCAKIKARRDKAKQRSENFCRGIKRRLSEISRRDSLQTRASIVQNAIFGRTRSQESQAPANQLAAERSASIAETVDLHGPQSPGSSHTHQRHPRPRFQDAVPTTGALEAAEGYDDDSVPWQTKPDRFGIFRIYSYGKPSYTPDAAFTLLHYAEAGPSLQHNIISFQPSFPPDSNQPNPGDDTGVDAEPDWLGAEIFPNISIALIMRWFYSSQSVICSKQRTDSLIKDVLTHPEFDSDHLKGFRMDLGMEALDAYDAERVEESQDTPFPISDGWKSSTVYLSVPCPGVKQTEKKGGPKQFPVKNVMHRSLMDVIMAAFRDPSAEYFHLTPFKEFYQPPGYGKPSERQYGELYTSDAFLEAHDEVRKLAEADDCPHEVVVAAIMLGSDSTLLANFGTQSLWPIYLALGNLSKYIRANMSSFAMHHLAYIPKLPDDLNDWWSENFGGTSPCDDAFSHLRCELMQAIWLLLLDENLMDAYLHGRDSNDFPDGKTRRVYPRFFTYACDYLEKILLICIKNLSNCPCPRCLVLKSQVDQLGTPEDMAARVTRKRTEDSAVFKAIKKARDALYKKGSGFKNDVVVKALGPQSLRPTRNAFSLRLAQHGVNSYDLVAPDLLHEFELGVFKSIFTHLLRIVQCEGKLADIDARYRQFPSFGTTIRRFRNNVSAMSKFTARDFEDVLQCSIPAFEGLIPEPHGTVIREMLFELCTWHALAKLRRISDPGTAELEASTERLGVIVRRFRDETCLVYDTTDLPSRQSNRSKKKKRAARKREFSMITYKLHGIGHTPRYIRRKGTSDSYSSQNVEHAHKSGKRHKHRAPSAKDLLLGGIAKQVRRERLIWEMNEQHKRAHRSQPYTRPPTSSAFDSVPDSERIPASAPDVHHSLCHKVASKDQKDLLRWVSENSDDPAVENYVRELRTHILLRLYGQERFNSDEDELDNLELRSLLIINNKTFHHKTLHVNFTTYDLRREQAYINPERFSVVMLLSNEDYDPDGPNHPYWYAQVLDIFHCRVIHTGPLSKSKEPQTFEVLRVRWLAPKGGSEYGFRAKNLLKLQYVDAGEDGSASFGFINPAEVVRPVYLIPDEDCGRAAKGLRQGSSVGRRGPDQAVYKDGLDWDTFWLNTFVDRDMFMRYRGGAPGHAAVRDAVDEFLSDRDPTDIRHLKRRTAELAGEPQPSDEGHPPAHAAEMQNNNNPQGWDDDLDAMDEDEDDDWGYRRELEVDRADYVPSDENDDECSEDGGRDRIW